MYECSIERLLVLMLNTETLVPVCVCIWPYSHGMPDKTQVTNQ